MKRYKSISFRKVVLSHVISYKLFYSKVMFNLFSRFLPCISFVLQRCPRSKSLSASVANQRTAHSSRKSDVEHLHSASTARQHVRYVRCLSRPRRHQALGDASPPCGSHTSLRYVKKKTSAENFITFFRVYVLTCVCFRLCILRASLIWLQ